MLKGATIVFDLDGTLIDTAPDPTHALNHVLTHRGHAAVSTATVRSGVGFGIHVMIEETLRRLGVTDDLDEMLAEFYDRHSGRLRGLHVDIAVAHGRVSARELDRAV